MPKQNDSVIETHVAIENRKYVAKAAETLTASFTWSKTVEGHTYWQAVCKRLYCLSNGERLDEPQSDVQMAHARGPRLATLLRLLLIAIENAGCADAVCKAVDSNLVKTDKILDDVKSVLTEMGWA
jgi:hypothetical protein